MGASSERGKWKWKGKKGGGHIIFSTPLFLFFSFLPLWLDRNTGYGYLLHQTLYVLFFLIFFSFWLGWIWATIIFLAFFFPSHFNISIHCREKCLMMKPRSRRAQACCWELLGMKSGCESFFFFLPGRNQNPK